MLGSIYHVLHAQALYDTTITDYHSYVFHLVHTSELVSPQFHSKVSFVQVFAWPEVDMDAFEKRGSAFFCVPVEADGGLVTINQI